MKNKTNDENLGHIWKQNGDVKLCFKCDMGLGLWDGIKPCPFPKNDNATTLHALLWPKKK
jgi:hypothetical protein